MREIQSEVIGDRRVRLIADQAGRYAVTIEVWGQRVGRILASTAIATSAYTRPADATDCGAASRRRGQSNGIRDEARQRPQLSTGGVRDSETAALSSPASHKDVG
jgi:hypothetical protein